MANSGQIEGGARAETPVLEFVDARLLLDAGLVSAPVTLALAAGSLVLIGIAEQMQGALIADAAIGLRPPAAGAVRFLARDWRQTPAVYARAMRGRIGQLFAAGNWLQGRSVLENLLWPQLYHTRRPRTELCAAAARLASAFGLPGVPLDDPARLSPLDLQRAACVRAFLGQPRLVILEEPPQGLFSEILEPLINAIRTARDQGAAVLWLSADAALWSDRSLPVDARYRLRSGALHSAVRAA